MKFEWQIFVVSAPIEPKYDEQPQLSEKLLYQSSMEEILN